MHTTGVSFGTATWVHPATAVGQNRPRTPCPGCLSAVEETVTDIEHADRPDQFSAVHRMVGGVRVVTVEGEIDHTVRELLSSALLSGYGAEPPSRIVVDLSGVTFMDSSGINVFVAAYQQVSGAQGWLRIAGAQDSVLRVLQIVGVDTVIPCHPTIEQALNT